MSTVMHHHSSAIAPSPQCQTCVYLMPSESSRTGLRCGLQYFNTPLLVRKFLQMKHFPEVKAFNACESWLSADQSSAHEAN
ncbi:MAG: hypothetical protein EBR42_07470 [Betaproteobacteria bacterium]|jgi:hypothetical protein|nr:hypothetical protein [Betaproteobacteria bacterium]